MIELQKSSQYIYKGDLQRRNFKSKKRCCQSRYSNRQS